MYNPTERAVSRILFRMTSHLSLMGNFNNYLHNCVPTSEPSPGLRLLVEVTSDYLLLMMEVASVLQFAMRHSNSTSASTTLQSLRVLLRGWRADFGNQSRPDWYSLPRVK